MALRPPSLGRTIRALAEAHLRTAMNASFRDAGKWLTAIATLFTAALSLMALTMVIGGAMGLGYVSATAPLAAGPRVAAWLFTVVPVLAGFFSMLNGDARSLDWQRLKAYPVAPLALFLAEVMASCFQLLLALAMVGMVAFTAGLAFGPGGQATAALPALLCALLTTLAVRAVLATVAGWLVRRLQMVFLLGAVLLPAPAMLMAFDPAMLTRSERSLGALERLTDYLPAAAQLGALQAEGWAGFAARTLAPFLVPALLFTLSYALAFREVDPVAQVNRAPEKLWSHRSRVVSLARLTLLSIWSSDVGRIQLLTPLLFSVPFLVVRAQLATFLRPELAFFIVWTMTPTLLINLSLNQFGSDRGAVKALLLLPIAPRELLQGKALGLAMVTALDALILSAVAFWLLRPEPRALVLGPLAGVALFLVGLTVGQFTSIAWPRPLPVKGLRAPQGGVVLGFVSLGLLFFVSVPMMLLSYWLEDRPLALLLVLGLFVAASFSLFVGSTRLAERFFVARRERLVETLG